MKKIFLIFLLLFISLNSFCQDNFSEKDSILCNSYQVKKAIGVTLFCGGAFTAFVGILPLIDPPQNKPNGYENYKLQRYFIAATGVMVASFGIFEMIRQSSNIRKLELKLNKSTGVYFNTSGVGVVWRL